MNRLQQIQARKNLLVAQAAAQRTQLARECDVIEQPFRITQDAFSLLRSSLVLTGLAALLLKTRWRRFASLPKWVWRGWQLVRIARAYASVRW